MNCPHGRPDKAACPHCCFQATLIEGDAKDARIAELEAENAALRLERDIAVEMLAEWCDAIKRKGTDWDDWDEYYKDAAFRPGPLRSLIDAALDRYAKAIGGER